MRKHKVFLGAFALLAATAVLAQEPKPMTAVAFFKVKPGMAAQWVDTLKKVYVPELDKLMSEGSVLAYGAAGDMFHRAGATNFAAWYVVPNYAAMEKVENAFDAAQASHKDELDQFLAATDMDMHHDALFRSIVGSHKTPTAGTLPYLAVSRVRVKPGKGQDYRKGFEKYVKPTLDKLVADGTLLGYDLHAEDVHMEDPGWRWDVIVTPDLASMDKVDAAFEAMRKGRSEEERKTMQQEYMEVVDVSSHRDSLLHAVVFASK